MVEVTLILNTSEWMHIADAALTLWPNLEIDRQVSRNEVCRRLALCGIERLMAASAVQRQSALAEVDRPLQPPPDHIMPMLPGAPRPGHVVDQP
jgi:hypothetical protein